jgi:hypothetical protein
LSADGADGLGRHYLAEIRKGVNSAVITLDKIQGRINNIPYEKGLKRRKSEEEEAKAAKKAFIARYRRSHGDQAKEERKMTTIKTACYQIAEANSGAITIGDISNMEIYKAFSVTTIRAYFSKLVEEGFLICDTQRTGSNKNGSKAYVYHIAQEIVEIDGSSSDD